jgi:aromatic-L-amino-acid decarboxylase
MDPEAVREAVTADRLAGLRPALVVASAGTTNTGSVDPLTALADVARDEDLWLHVDAAYGGFFILTERGRARLRGIERADSITLDPHKGMFLPYGVGALLVRDGERLRRAHTDAAVYLADIQDVYADAGLPNFAELSPELTRDFRGLRVWLPLHLHGVAAFRAALDEKLDLARVVHDGLVADGRFAVPYEPDLSIVPFRLRGADDAANRALLEAINASGRVLVSGTVIDDAYWVRAAVLAHRTHRDHIDEFLAVVGASADRVLAGRLVT